MSLLLAITVSWLLGDTIGTLLPPLLTCSARADAAALVAATCAATADCRFEFDVPALNWEALLGDGALGLLGGIGGGTDDVTRYFWPTAWRAPTAALLLGVDADAPDAQDCAALAAATADGSARPPLAAIVVVDLLVKWQHYVSGAARCTDPNEVPLWDNATGVPRMYCVCAANKVCHMTFEPDGTLLWVIAVLVAVLGLLLTVYVIITSVMLLRKADANAGDDTDSVPLKARPRAASSLSD